MRAAGYVEDASESDDDDKPPKPAVPAPAPKVEAPDLLPVSLTLRGNLSWSLRQYRPLCCPMTRVQTPPWKLPVEGGCCKHTQGRVSFQLFICVAPISATAHGCASAAKRAVICQRVMRSGPRHDILL